MRTYVYVDGLNLYYRALRGSSWRWLDLPALFRMLLQSHHDILKVRYFTAKIIGTPSDPDQQRRQEVYLRALKHHRPEVEFHYGHFLRHEVDMPLANSKSGKRFVKVVRVEEKGSDVNFAVHLLNDGWRDRFDCAVVVTNDSDMAESMRLLKQEHPGKRIGLISPDQYRRSPQLKECADFTLHLHHRFLSRAQLPDTIPGTNLRKPLSW